MASDLYFTPTGDIAISTKGDLAVTSSHAEFLGQQSNSRLATRLGDFTPYPRYGGDLQRLVGLPNTPKTARLGVQLIQRALSYDGLLGSGSITIEATPTMPDVIEFEVKIAYGTREALTLTLSQLLSL